MRVARCALDWAFEALSSNASVGSGNGNVSYVSGDSGLEEPLTPLRLSEESEDMEEGIGATLASAFSAMAPPAPPGSLPPV